MALAQQTLWARRLEYKGQNDAPNALAIDGSGDVFVVGTTSATNVLDVLVAKYSPDGQRLWKRKFGRSDRYEFGSQARLDAQGNLVIAGYTNQGDGYADFLVMKVDPGGNLLWRRTYADPSGFGDVVHSLAVDADGNIIVTGITGASLDAADVLTIKYAPDGKTLWMRRYGTVPMLDAGYCVATDSSRNVYVAGTTAGNGSDYDVVTLKYNPNGNLLWTQRFDGPYGLNDYPIAMSIDSAGNPVIAATTFTSASVSKVAVFKYSTHGATLWKRVYGVSNGRNEWVSAATLDSADNVVVAGVSVGPSSADYLVLKYGSDGKIGWSRLYDSAYGFEDIPNGVSVDGLGSVYVTGGSAESSDDYNGMDYATIKYSPEGTRQWVRRYDSPSHLGDVGNRIAVAPDGNVVVTGYSLLSSIDVAPDADFFTIKYQSGP